MAEAKVTPAHGAEQVRQLLDSPEVRAFVRELDDTRWTGRPGYGNRALVGLALAKSVYCLPTWSRACRLVAEHDALRAVLGGAPSQQAAYRFTRRLAEHRELLGAALDAVVARLAVEMPGYGDTLAIDGSDMPAYANGQKYVRKGGPLRERYSDPDASWGHRSAVSTRAKGSFYGFKLHAAICTTTGLPVAWTVRTAKDSEHPEVAALLDIAKGRGVVPSVAVLDKGYDSADIYAELIGRKIRPVISLSQSLRVKRGEHLPPTCGHGEWTFAGADDKRQATKWRCPTGACKPASLWRPYSRLHPPIPHDSERWWGFYRQRGAVERGFGSLKNEHGLAPLRVRRIGRVRLHADLTILTTLAAALARARAVPLAA
jgi:hypothetical protein